MFPAAIRSGRELPATVRGLTARARHADLPETGPARTAGPEGEVTTMAESTTKAAVLFDVIEPHIALVTLNRPEARNAVNGAVASGLEQAVERSEGAPDLWVAILTGAGPVFSAGADLKEVSSGNGAALSTKKGGFGGFV